MSKEDIFRSTEMKGKLRYLTVSMALMLVLYPFLEGGITQTIILNILVSAICFSGVYAVSSSKKNLIIALALGVPWFATSWITLIIPSPSVILVSISTSFLMLFYAFTALMILLFVLKSEQISGDILYGAVSVYLLIGGAFSMIYVLIETLYPGSFSLDLTHSVNGAVDWADFLYYSFTTLTTMGYGDITPSTSHARSFAMLEALIGVMYLAIIIGRLVGLYIAHSIKKD